MGGHIGLVFSKTYPEMVRALVLTGSSGLYENSMGDSYPKRENYDYIKAKSEEVFYDPAVATKEIVDEVFETVNDRNKLIKTLAIAKSAIRHNMSKDLPKMETQTCLIWGKMTTLLHLRLRTSSTTSQCRFVLIENAPCSHDGTSRSFQRNLARLA